MSTKDKTFNIPTVLVLMGITGDLVEKKILKGLFQLFIRGHLPEKFQVYGFAHTEYTDESIREYLRELMEEQSFNHKDQWDEFLSMFMYEQADFDNSEAYTRLAERMGMKDDEWSYCTNKLFYLAVPPKFYDTIVQHLSDSGLTKPCSDEDGWTRVILEKPFGSDLHSAQKLDELLGELFEEKQIYRVDHYLAKETVRNILAFRYGNSFLAPAWSTKNIEKIEVNMFETEDISNRVKFYDGVGAFRDFGKNHMMQLLALFTMHHPESRDPEEFRAKRAAVFECMCCLTEEEIARHTLRAQYKGYRDQEGIADDSMTETYFAIKTKMQSGPLEGVPVIMRHGKALDVDLKEVKVTFKKHPSMDLYAPKVQSEKPYENALHYHISPDESIKIRFFVKKPGYDDTLVRQNFGFSYADAFESSEEVSAYEQILMDIIQGDQTLFVSTHEIMQQWAFVEPLMKAWNNGKPELQMYEKGTRPEAEFA